MPTTAVITNNGLTLLAAALQSTNNTAAITYVAVGTGAGTLTTGVTSGVAVTSLAVSALSVALTASQSLTIINGTNTATVTVAANASIGATTVSINSWTPSFSYPSGSGVVSTPLVTDTGLQNETYRLAVSAASAGGNPGETLLSAYFDPSTPSATYLEVGFFGGSAASTTAGSGTLVARQVMWEAHTLNADSFTAQLDSTL